MLGILDRGGAASGLIFGILAGIAFLLTVVAALFIRSRLPLGRADADEDWGARPRADSADDDDADAINGEALIFLAGETVQDVNRACCEILGLAADATVGVELARFFPPDCYRDLQRLMKDRNGLIETQITTAAGARRDVEVGVRPPPADRPDLSAIALRDITDRKAAERKNQITVLTDPLTCAGNRVLYHERLRQAIERAQRGQTCVAVISVGVDHLDAINNGLGYAVGHGVLFEIAARLFAATRGTDTVARLADAEFAVIATSLSQYRDILSIALRLLRRLNEPYVIEDRTVEVNARIGIALYPDDTRIPESLIIFARRARERAARETANGLGFFTNEMNDLLRNRITLLDEFGVAVERHQFEPHFEGIFDIRTLEMCGYHASLRWQHPTRGTVLPDAFLPVAEASGEVNRLADWELEQACAFSTALSTPTTISLGVSAGRLRREDLCQRTLGILGRWQIPPQGLELEVAEGLLDNNTDAAFATLSAFKAAGMRVSLVYGMASRLSLEYHERFEFYTIKLDHTLSAAVDKDAAAQRKCAIILAVAKSLGIEGVAEGVETREQLVLLAKLGCRRVQGPVVQHLARSGVVKAHKERLSEKA